MTKDIVDKVKDINLDEISITSSFEILDYDEGNSGFKIEEIENISVEVKKITGHKCQRCWKYKQKLIDDKICNRCKEAIEK